MKERVAPGRSGLARAGTDPAEAYWLENWQILRDGVYRPRFGTKYVATVGTDPTKLVTHLSKAPGYNHNLMVCTSDGVLSELDVETGTLTGVDTGWPGGPFSWCLAPSVSAGGNVWVACQSSIGGSVGDVVMWDGTTLTVLPCDQGNWVACHGDYVVRLASGDTGTDSIQWSSLGKAEDWPVQNARAPLPQMGSTDAILPYNSSDSILLGPYGFGRLYGRNPDRPAWENLENALLLTPMHLNQKCRDRIIVAAAGPALLEYVPPGLPRRIELPLGLDLLLAEGSANLRSWYNPILNCYCLTDNLAKQTYLYSIDQARFIGTWSVGDDLHPLLGQADIDQGASAFDADEMPWGKSFFGWGPLVVQIDPTKFKDATGPSTDEYYFCRVETMPSTGADPTAEKQLNSIQVDGTGDFTPYYRYRSGPLEPWTTVTEPSANAWKFTAPGKFHFPLSHITYRERVVGLEAAAVAGLRFRSMEIDEDVVGLAD